MAAAKTNSKMDFYAIMPAYNEGKNIRAVLERAKKIVGGKRIIVVDDGSKDATAAEAAKQGVTVLRHIINLGKGAALRTGSQYAHDKGADVIVYMDSDGQHDPEDLPGIIEALKGNDIVFTYRDRRSQHMPIVKKVGNWFIDAAMKLLFHINVIDTQCGYKAMTRQAYEKLNLMSNDYSIESEIVAKTGKYRLRFTQLPIRTFYSDRYKGTTVFDGINIVLKMLWWRMAR
ncbi:glycosyltransferase family 2 protein [Candidatus Woesearchaeota archaeon]|nr:glycosyltransferase family 2 protein [Candidatus Woesearchaeota archaeon]